MKHKPEYEIIKTSYDVEREKIKEKLDATCPECGNYDTWNSGLTDGEYNYYTCEKCGCKYITKFQHGECVSTEEE